MANKFFEEENENQEEESEKIRLGESEFTQEELDELVGAGRKLKEIEEKQGQPVEDILKSWGKRGERLGEWKRVTGAKKPDEFLAKIEEEKSKQVGDPDKEKLREQIIAEAKQYGFVLEDDLKKSGYLTKEEFKTMQEGERILRDVKKTIKSNVKKGYPEVSADKLIEYMRDPRNPADPANAYDLMFKEEIKKADMEKLQSIKGKPMYTDTKSTAGGKNFTPKKPTNLEDLRNALKTHMGQQ